MYEKLLDLQKNSYAPYSNYKVSCIVVMKDGSSFFGVNVENASYGASMCAERSAILSAISNGYKKGDFKSINIMVNGDSVGTPCFLCRQVIMEFFDNDCEVLCMNTNGEEKRFLVSDLCPYPFTEEDLK